MPDGLGSPDWLRSLAELGAALPARPGATASLSVVVTGGPDGEVAWRCSFVDGRVASVEPGPAAEGDADLVVTRTYDDVLAELRGEHGLDVAFMRGQAKVAGSTAVLMRLLPVLRSEEWRAACSELLARTAA
jgi:hypothetical protein